MPTLYIVSKIRVRERLDFNNMQISKFKPNFRVSACHRYHTLWSVKSCFFYSHSNTVFDSSTNTFIVSRSFEMHNSTTDPSRIHSEHNLLPYILRISGSIVTIRVDNKILSPKLSIKNVWFKRILLRLAFIYLWRDDAMMIGSQLIFN